MSAASLAITACTEIDGDPLAFLAPGPPNNERPEIPNQAELQQMTPGAATVALAPTDPFVALPAFQPQPGGMKGTLGLNLETYMQQNSGTPEERIARLERVIVAMHRDMQAMGTPLQGSFYAPATTKLITMQPVMDGPITAPVIPPQNLQPIQPPSAPIQQPVQQPAPQPIAAAAPQPLTPPVANDTGEDSPEPELELLVSAPLPPDAQIAQPITSAAAPTPAPVLEPITPPAATNGAVTATGIRVGAHPDRVRLVIDVSADTPFTVDLDNAENLLIIELPQAAWGAPLQEQFSGIPLMKSYKVDSVNNTGSLVVVQLDKATTILSQSKMPSANGDKQRVVIDLQK